jgi:hypothetical protein
VKTSRRVTVTPATALALVALFFALGGSAFALGDRAQSAFANQKRCADGAVRGIAVVTGQPSAGIANVPDRFTSAASYFARRFNCAGKGIHVRRVEAGVFEVRFVGITGASGVGSGTSDSYANVERPTGDTFRVTVHPAGRDDRADLPFTIVVM